MEVSSHIVLNCFVFIGLGCLVGAAWELLTDILKDGLIITANSPSVREIREQCYGKTKSVPPLEEIKVNLSL